MHYGSTFIWSYPLIPIGALFHIFFFLSSDRSLVPLTPPRPLNLEILELVKMETYGGVVCILFLLSQRAKKGHFERLDIES